ncbi:MAG TPA: hypothetical protein VKR58_11995 [Aquella sp.]|nr:hypothetical protein [Aquella sp.]
MENIKLSSHILSLFTTLSLCMGASQAIEATYCIIGDKHLKFEWIDDDKTNEAEITELKTNFQPEGYKTVISGYKNENGIIYKIDVNLEAKPNTRNTNKYFKIEADEDTFPPSKSQTDFKWTGFVNDKESLIAKCNREDLGKFSERSITQRVKNLRNENNKELMEFTIAREATCTVC